MLKPYHAYARLARASDRMPWRGRLFGVGTDRPGIEIVDMHDSFTLALFADGSIVPADPPATPSSSGPAPLAPAPARADH